ncbi:hypothetical protein SESBI_17120 [Sesbania bispinosa]|nr:hypothetical protein SESBI_17120 [Sesbania bispinosa]
MSTKVDGPEGELTLQEKNQLDRSIGKAKVDIMISSPETFVQETQVEIPPCPQVVKFQTTTNMGLERKMSEEDTKMFEATAGNMDGESVVRVAVAERESIRIPWKRAILVKILDWDDLQHAFEDGPWILAGHYIVIQRWKTDFSPYDDDLCRVAVWIRMPGLPIEYYDKRVLWRVSNVLGKIVNIDPNTLSEKGNFNGEFTTERAKFARICIEGNEARRPVGAQAEEDSFSPWMIAQSPKGETRKTLTVSAA